jgi:hypothetical protein
MIHYQLRCSADHEFDGWFKDSASFDLQARRGLLECPECGTTDVSRAMMAPMVPRKRESAPPPPSAPAKDTAVAVRPGAMPAKIVAALQRLRAEVEQNCTYVGDAFAEEARRIHNGESDKRGIYGETTDEQAERLAEDGIAVARIPWIPRADG